MYGFLNDGVWYASLAVVAQCVAPWHKECSNLPFLFYFMQTFCMYIYIVCLLQCSNTRTAAISCVLIYFPHSCLCVCVFGNGNGGDSLGVIFIFAALSPELNTPAKWTQPLSESVAVWDEPSLVPHYGARRLGFLN